MYNPKQRETKISVEELTKGKGSLAETWTEKRQKDSVRVYCESVLLHDFRADVKDWMFHNLLQLNLDKTGIIQGEEKLEWLQSVLLCFAACTAPSLSVSLPLSLNLSLPLFPSSLLSLFVFLFISQTKHWLLAFGQSHLETKSAVSWLCILGTSAQEFIVWVFIIVFISVEGNKLFSSLKAWVDLDF